MAAPANRLSGLAESLLQSLGQWMDDARSNGELSFMEDVPADGVVTESTAKVPPVPPAVNAQSAMKGLRKLCEADPEEKPGVAAAAIEALWDEELSLVCTMFVQVFLMSSSSSFPWSPLQPPPVVCGLSCVVSRIPI